MEPQIKRLESSDPWEWVEWMLTHERDLYVRQERINEQRGKQMTLIPMFCLDPAQWVFWCKRVFFDRTTPVKTYAAWRAWEAEHDKEPAADMPGWDEKP